jgi:hypothetical protein
LVQNFEEIFMYNLISSQALRKALAAGLLLSGVSASAWAVDTSVLPGGTINSGAMSFTQGDLVVSSSFYEGTANPIVIGSTVLSGANAGATTKAGADSSYLTVWNNAATDASFGVTAPILLSDVNTSGSVVSTFNVTAIAAAQGFNLATSFPSKSELAVNLSTDNTALTFNGYNTSVGQLDVSNSNTPGVIDSTNPSIATPTYRTVAQINPDGSLSTTNTNAYSGNNGRATILDSTTNTYLMVGNAGNSGKNPAPSAAQLAALSANTGVQSITAGSANPNTTVIGALSSDGQYGFSVTQTNPLTTQPYSTTSSKVGKDDNFRGETVFNNTLYVTKGSGSNGINTVYQVGNVGGVHNLNSNSTITVLPGLPVDLANGTGTHHHPFGIWFANATTLYVADEGAGGTITANGGATGAAATDANAGLEKWVFNSTTGQWEEKYTIQAGLNLGISYTVSGTSIGSNNLNGTTGSYTAATDGLRTLTGHVNADGSVSLYAVTSTISNAGDQGADPNKLVAVNDYISATSIIASQGALGSSADVFNTLQTAQYGQVLRGVSFAPVPLPSSVLMMLSGLGFTALFGRRNKKA